MSVKKKPLVVVTRKLPDSIETRMRELFDARLNLDDTPLTPGQIAEAVRSADILVPTVTDLVTEELLKQPDCKLKLIANFGNGVDNIDVVAAHARGITVTNTPKVLTEDTADMTMALILAVPRRLIEGATIIPEGKNWPGWSPTWMLGHRSASSAWAASARRWRAGRAPSACRFIITTAVQSRRASPRNWARPIGKASTRCWRGWTSSR
jgi:glyoxylate reductase